ncbi:PREDICTED: uncharacterized protein LOC104767831 [Camelina sativa]|uniref:Uncharacterized protein LOC104767831 n=1 Tax=Camelina sativa TaxID=90675 RepID=A0ABM0XS00_CAMSA|nr:PREDICTED: uncharacterized protein LOC104767831 [Camelina sativa]
MDEAYKIQREWYHHGEVVSVDSNVSQWNEEVLGLYRAAEYLDEELAAQGDEELAAQGQLVDDAEGEADDKKEDEFFAKLADAETSLYPMCASHSKLSAIVSLYRIKTENGWSDKSFNDLLRTLPDMLPEENKLKKFDNCPKCKASRWKVNMHTGQIKKGVPQKVLRYFPIIPRLKRMFRYEQLAKDLRWHFSNKSSDGKLRHPVDSVTWDQMNAKYPAFAAEPRNIRLGLSTDGFNPFNMKNNIYCCWPVLLVNYNMAPDLCMKKDNIMLSLLIPGPQQPGNSIDVYLEPLIEDLNHLWSKGEIAYDAFSKSSFTLKVMLLWTISDFPAYGNLAGCKFKGKMGCPLCGKDIDSTWLSNSRKHVYMCHRKGLSPTHSYRGKKTWFDGKAEHGRKGRILIGHNISVLLKNFKNDFGNKKESGKKRKQTAATESSSSDESDDTESEEEEKDEEELSRWKKRSIFFKLSYWEILRHNLDVMHVERNVAASIVATLLHCGKSKDGLKTRKDLQLLGIRKDLHPRESGKRIYLPAAPWSLSKAEKKVFCLLPKGPRIAISRLCSFFNHLCQRVVDMEKITALENKIMETLCMFERFFPPSFFDIMVHLCVHLGRETRLGGPVHFRWMHPFERYTKVLKDFVRNPARPEGCIAESYLAEECMEFCKRRPISAGLSVILSDMEKKIAHLAVIQNTALVEPYVDMHLQYLQDSNIRCRRDASIPVDSDDHDHILKWSAYGPRTSARTYTGYIVNGLRFHTNSVDRLSQNSGVFYEATTMCRSSAKDTSQVADWVSYYGRVTDIILLDYNVFYVPLFKCQWAVRGNGVKIEDGFTLVNLKQSQTSFSSDPYILASQAKQVFYSREDDSSSWYVVMRGPSRRYNEEAVNDGLPEVGPLPSTIDMVIEDVHEDES